VLRLAENCPHIGSNAYLAAFMSQVGLVIDDARSPFEFCLCDSVGYRRGGMALVSVRLCRLDIQALIHMGDAADRFRGDWRDGLSTSTIEWINKDIFAHTATARNGDWDVTMPPKKTVTSVLNKAGAVEYYCRFHPNMKATLVVAPLR
jgi:hypothetical protein